MAEPAVRAVAATPGWRDLARSPDFGRVVVVSFGVWLHAADELMVSTISPAMVADIGGTPFVAWLIALYEIGSIVAGALAAVLVARTSLRAAMAGAGLAYMAGCLCSAAAPDMPVMLAGRLVQGLGGGAMIATAFVAVHRLVSPDFTARVYALISLVWGVSAFTGPLIGAGFADIGHWRGAFVLFAAQAGLFSAVSFVQLAESTASSAPRPAGGELAMLLRLAVLAVAITAIASAGIAAAGGPAAALLIGGLALAGGFLALDRRAGANRLLPDGAFDWRRPHGAALGTVLLFSVATIGLITYGPLLMTRLHGLGALAVGLILLLESAGWSVVAVATAGLPRRFEPMAIYFGFAAVALGVAAFIPAMTYGPVGLIALSAFLQGAGMGAAWAFLVRRSTSLAPASERDRTASAIPTIQRAGYAVGAALVGLLANAAGFGEDASVEIARETSIIVFAASLLPAAVGLVAVHRFLQFR